MEDARAHLIRSGEIKTADPSWENEFINKEFLENQVNPLLGYMRDKCVEADLNTARGRIDGRFGFKLRTGITYAEMINQLMELRRDIEDDLEYRRFVFIPHERALKVDAIGRDWEDIWLSFPGAREDSRDAVECFGIGKSTACVFHLMRVTEYGLRAVALSLGITRARSRKIEWAEWQDILREIDKQVLVKANKRVGPKRDEELEFYRGAIGEFSGFKDAYRNHVMHARGSYDIHQAASVLSHVHDFMYRIGEKIDAKGKKHKKKL